MSAADTSLVDLASAAVADVTPAVDSTVEVPSIDTDTTVDTAVETPVTEEVVVEAGKETETHNEDGSEKTPEEREAYKQSSRDRTAREAEEKAFPSLKATRDAFKALKEGGADPAALKTLSDGLKNSFRMEALKPLLGTGGISSLKTFLEEIGSPSVTEARTAYQEQSNIISAVKAADELLNSGDKQLAVNVWQDLKTSQGETAAATMGKTVQNFVDFLKSNEETRAAYYDSVSKPNLHSSLIESKFPTVLNALHNALQSGDTAAASKVLQNIVSWWNGLDEELSESGKISAERERWEAEKVEAAKGESSKATKAWESSVAETADRYNNTALSKSLGTYLRQPYFRNFPRETLIDLGNGIKSSLYNTLRADSAYQRQMNALWKGGNNPANNAKIQAYHQQTLDRIAQDVVTKVITTRFPNWAKGGSAAGRVAAAAEKKTTDAKSAANSVATGQPQYIPTKPKNLVREDIVVAGKAYTPSSLQVMEIAGKGFLKTPNGVRLITWRKQ